jgi:hypothetical protein
VAIAVVTAIAIWAAGEHFGGVTDGMATDPNSGPLLALIALAFWPLRNAAAAHGAAPNQGATEAQGAVARQD